MSSTNLNNTISISRPNAKINTIDMYVSNLNKLQKIFEVDNFNFLKDVDQVMDVLKNKHYTTIRNYLNAIIVYLLAINSDATQDTLIKQYQGLRDDKNQEYETFNATHQISTKQAPNFVNLKDVLAMIEQMGDDLKGYKKRDLDKKDMMLLQVYIIFNIHVRLPLRLDLADCHSIHKRFYNQLSIEDKKKQNWLIIEKSHIWMSVNKFKTSAKFEELKIDIPKDLEKLLRSYIRIRGMGQLITTSSGKAMTRNQLTKTLIKYSQRYMNGVSISSNILRKIVLSDSFCKSNQQKEAMSKITAHSVSTMDKIYIKEGQGTVHGNTDGKADKS
tara:strand:+ start:4751 stop:5740 length:990 start_codon:yes stop_codon:yes gene_type:complete